MAANNTHPNPNARAPADPPRPDPPRPDPPMTPGRRDVEKRWGDPAGYRGPMLYAVLVVVIAMVFLLLFALLDGMLAMAVAVPATFLIGGLGALGLGMSTYMRRRSWVGWEGTAWFLLVLMLVALPLPAMAL